jgi:ubiquinone/menaquinone biosynthesis C-methylase UbiE
MLPDGRTNQSIEFYERTASAYDDERWGTRGGAILNYFQQNAVTELLGDVQDKTVLEVAVGTGRFALNLASRGAKVTGLDSSPAMLKISGEKAHKAGVSERVTLVEGGATSLPFPDASFDAVICINALNHIPNQVEVLREIARVAKHSATVVTNYTNFCSPYLPVALYVLLRGRAWNKDVYTTWFSPPEIGRLHRLAGLKIERTCGVVHWPVWLSSRVCLAAFRVANAIFHRPPLDLLSPQIFVSATPRLAAKSGMLR